MPEPGGLLLSVIFPAYNEQDALAGVVERALALNGALARVGVGELEVLVVDDGSTDGTTDVAAALVAAHPRVRVLCHPANRGYGAALKTGLSAARGDLLAFLDSDGSYPPESLPDLCRAALAGCDLAIGSRMAGAESHMPPLRWVGNWLFAALVSLLGRQRVQDSASGMRVLRREVWAQLHPLPDGLNFTPAMTARAGGRLALIVGAGRGGALAVRELLQNPDLGCVPAGFVDDDATKHRTRIDGYRVFGPIDQLGQIIDAQRASVVIVAIRDIETERFAEICAVCDARGVDVRRMRFSLEDADWRDRTPGVVRFPER